MQLPAFHLDSIQPGLPAYAGAATMQLSEHFRYIHRILDRSDCKVIWADLPQKGAENGHGLVSASDQVTFGLG